jgi:hypothetical protein
MAEQELSRKIFRYGALAGAAIGVFVGFAHAGMGDAALGLLIGALIGSLTGGVCSLINARRAIIWWCIIICVMASVIALIWGLW